MTNSWRATARLARDQLTSGRVQDVAEALEVRISQYTIPKSYLYDSFSGGASASTPSPVCDCTTKPQPSARRYSTSYPPFNH